MPALPGEFKQCKELHIAQFLQCYRAVSEVMYTSMRQAPWLRRTRRGLFRWFGYSSHPHQATVSAGDDVICGASVPNERGRFCWRSFTQKRR